VDTYRQTRIHTAETLVPDPSHFEVQISITKSQRHILPGSDQILVEMIHSGIEEQCS
jgi:hypothetical protein